MNASEKISLIEDIITRLAANYVFPEIATEMETALRAKLSSFRGLTGNDLAATLTDILQAVSRDKHLRVRYREEPFSAPQENGEPTLEDMERMRQEEAEENFGFQRIEILEKNIGYIDLRGFAPPDWAGPKAAAAMTLLSDTKALIIDLRQNGGGSPETVALLCSYFFPAEPTIHLNSIYNRPTNTTEQFWTTPTLPALRYLDKPVYLLTSHYTFSGAEEFSYNLRNLKRATLIGETTGGGAHPVEFQRLCDPHFLITVPNARAINPITGTNWEGVGVEPHIPTPADQAFDVARQKISEPQQTTIPARTNGQKPRITIQLTPSRPPGYSQERATPLQVIV